MNISGMEAHGWMEICKYRVVVVHNNQISVNPNYTYKDGQKYASQVL